MEKHEHQEQLLYDEHGNWIGIETTETMTLEEAHTRYPHICFTDLPKELKTATVATMIERNSRRS